MASLFDEIEAAAQATTEAAFGEAASLERIHRGRG
jgi:hypothetical protein